MSITVPIFDPNRGWRSWNRPEIYTGPNGTGQYVPNVNDLVFDKLQGWLIVDGVDETTGLSTLTKWVEPTNPSINTDQDILLGTGPGYISETYALLYDDSVTPAILSCNASLYFHGETINSIRIFRGTDIGDASKIISRYYDQSGDFVGNDIPVKLVYINGDQTKSIKAPANGYTTEVLETGEVATVVAYDDQSVERSISRLRVVKTGFATTLDLNQVYVESIAIKSSYLSAGDARTLEIPVGSMADSLNLVGVVTYSNGRTVELPIDDTRFSLYGLTAFVPSQEDMTLPAVLSYRLAEGEASTKLTVAANRTINVTYTIKTTAVVGAYNVKLYGFPTWVNQLTGYRMEYWLYSLDRDICYRVTDMVELGVNSAAFNPLAYGTAQTMTVGIDLSRVSPSYRSHKHLQTMQVSLLRAPDSAGTLFTVGFSSGQNPLYGSNLSASMAYVSANTWTLNMSSGANTYEEWLERVYYSLNPLYNTATEGKAPVPNLMRLVFANFTMDLPMSSWNNNLTVPNDLGNGELLYVKFIRQYSNTDQELAVAALPVRIS